MLPNQSNVLSSEFVNLAKQLQFKNFTNDENRTIEAGQAHPFNGADTENCTKGEEDADNAGIADGQDRSECADHEDGEYNDECGRAGGVCSYDVLDTDMARSLENKKIESFTDSKSRNKS